VRALACPEANDVRCVIAGEGGERAAIEALIERFRLGDRVTLIGAVGSTALVEHLARCRAVCFPPRDEDYGFVTVEAFAAGKAVITCTDSGGPAELVEDGVNGLVSAPDPTALARGIARVMSGVDFASCLGEAARRTVSGMTWADAVRRLVIV
jgi:glycosyltransferase involved in cell wall biosynthesis